MTSPSAGLEDRNEPEDVFDFQEGPEMVSFFFPDVKKNSIKIISRGRVTLLGNITLFLISNCENIVLLFFLAADISAGSKQKWRVTLSCCERRDSTQDLGGKNCIKSFSSLAYLFRHTGSH